jgi:hypothetical protein
MAERPDHVHRAAARSAFWPNYEEIQGYVIPRCTTAQGDSHARTRKGRDERDEASLEGLPSAAMVGAARA